LKGHDKEGGKDQEKGKGMEATPGMGGNDMRVFEAK
jgi:hypothetical protein